VSPFEVGAAAKGWLHPGEGEALHRYAMEAAVAGGPLLEIGGYCGKSACYLGAAAQQSDTVLFSIDWHRGSPEMAPGRECHDPDMVGPDGVFDTLPHFRTTIRTAGLEDVVVPVAGSSLTVGRFWRSPVAMLFIDGAHDNGVLADFELFGPFVMRGGILAFHDADIPPIKAAGDLAEQVGFEPVEVVECLRVLRRPL
jgi:predicted O-methyltransferase YrrM